MPSPKDVLSGYVPQEARDKAPVEVDEDLFSIVERIARVLPPEKVWKWFSSTPGETGGEIRFPYARIDALTLASEITIHTLTTYPPTNPEEFEKEYEEAASYALQALIWVEIGFQGLENLAKSLASRNWTSAVGHFVDDKQREIGIMTTGREMYMRCLRNF